MREQPIPFIDYGRAVSRVIQPQLVQAVMVLSEIARPAGSDQILHACRSALPPVHNMIRAGAKGQDNAMPPLIGAPGTKMWLPHDRFKSVKEIFGDHTPAAIAAAVAIAAEDGRLNLIRHACLVAWSAGGLDGAFAQAPEAKQA